MGFSLTIPVEFRSGKQDSTATIHGAAATESDSTILQSVTGNFIEKTRNCLDSSWIGNIYLLDYTADQRAVILDRLQLANTSRIMQLQFFSLFLSHMVSVIAGATDGARSEGSRSRRDPASQSP